MTTVVIAAVPANLLNRMLGLGLGPPIVQGIFPMHEFVFRAKPYPLRMFVIVGRVRPETRAFLRTGPIFGRPMHAVRAQRLPILGLDFGRCHEDFLGWQRRVRPDPDFTLPVSHGARTLNRCGTWVCCTDPTLCTGRSGSCRSRCLSNGRTSSTADSACPSSTSNTRTGDSSAAVECTARVRHS